MRVLLTATVMSHIAHFHKSLIDMLHGYGCEVHIAARNDLIDKQGLSLDTADKIFDIPFRRSPYSFSNIKAYIELKKYIETYNYEIIHCNTPMGAVITRLAAKSLRKRGTKVLYTAHGFHFYRKAPIKNWLLYYPVEKWLSLYTDALITINQEDYRLARKRFYCDVFYVPGVGVDLSRFRPESFIRQQKREELGIRDGTVVLLSVGELSKNKNHATALKAISRLTNNNFLYIICGSGELEEHLKRLAMKLKIDHKVKFLGFRDDIPEVCLASDVFIFPSFREGLPVAVMEAMCAGLPIVCSAIRGNVDLVSDRVGGYLHDPCDVIGFAHSIEKLICDEELRNKMGRTNQREVIRYEKQVVTDIMQTIYKKLLDGDA